MMCRVGQRLGRRWAREVGTRPKVEASLEDVDFGYAQNKDWADPDMRRPLFQVITEGKEDEVEEVGEGVDLEKTVIVFGAISG